MSVLLIVILLLLVLIPFLLTTNLTVLLLLFLLIYLIFVRHIYMCMIAHKPDRLRRRSCGHNCNYSFQGCNLLNNNNNNNTGNNIEISMISSEDVNPVPAHSHFNTSFNTSTSDNVRRNNLLTIETLYVALQETDGQRSPGPPSYDEAIKNKHKLTAEEQPPNYSEAVKNLDV